MQVDGDRPGDLLRCVLEEVARRRQGRVGHQQVDGSGLLHEPVDVGEVLEIGGDRRCSELRGERLEDLEAAAAEHQLDTFRRQSSGDGLAEATGGSGDECAGSAQVDASGHGYSPLLLLKRAVMPW
jgi:hypothetical protein